MSRSIAHSILQRLSTLSPLILHAATWTVLLTMTVAVAAFTLELAFVSAVSPSSSFSRSCNADGFIRIPLALPGESLCLPAHLVKRYYWFDFFVPVLFAALVVVGSACVLRALGWWDDHSTGTT